MHPADPHYSHASLAVHDPLIKPRQMVATQPLIGGKTAPKPTATVLVCPSNELANLGAGIDFAVISHVKTSLEINSTRHETAPQAKTPGFASRVGGGGTNAAIARSSPPSQSDSTDFGFSGVFPGLDRDADQAASDAGVLAAAQSILNACREALTDLSRRAYGANRNSVAVDAVDDAVNALDEIATAVSMAGTAADGRENDALIALEGRP